MSKLRAKRKAQKRAKECELITNDASLRERKRRTRQEKQLELQQRLQRLEEKAQAKKQKKLEELQALLGEHCVESEPAEPSYLELLRSDIPPPLEVDDFEVHEQEMLHTALKESLLRSPSSSSDEESDEQSVAVSSSSNITQFVEWELARQEQLLKVIERLPLTLIGAIDIFRSYPNLGHIEQKLSR